MRKTFWLHLLLDPFTALDLVDQRGKPDHGKVLPAILLFSAIVGQFIDKPFASASLIILGSLAYGYGMWRSFLKSRTVVVSEQNSKQEIVRREYKEIMARRDITLGIDPTHE
jgi:hypothetical protein